MTPQITMSLQEVEALLPQIREMDGLIRDDLTIEIRPSAFWKQFNHRAIVVWANRNGYYCIPTSELVDWLLTEIADRPAIEVAAGSSGLFRALGILGTDSRLQATNDEVRLMYAACGIKPTEPPLDVITASANDAVVTYNPEVIVASWLTQKWLSHLPHGQDSPYGADEEEFFDHGSVKKYIHVGSTSSHCEKRILQRPHKSYEFDWLISRAIEPSTNRIWVWEKTA